MIRGWPVPRLYEGMTIADISDFLFLEDEPVCAELIFVFGGKNPQRALRAAELYKAGLAPRILVTGGFSRALGEVEADFLVGIMKQEGVPPEVVLREDRSANTEENVVMGREVLAKAGLLAMNRVLLVSAPSHMRRARMVFEHYFPGVQSICCPDRRDQPGRDNWWMSEEGRQMVFRELEKVRSLQHRGL